MFVADFIGSPSMNLLEGSLNNRMFKPNGSDNVQIPLEKYDFINKDINNGSIFLGIRPEHVYFEKVNEDCFGIKLKSEIIEYRSRTNNYIQFFGATIFRKISINNRYSNG